MRSVNFAVAVVACAGCTTMHRDAPPMPAAPVPGAVPDSVAVVWREDVGRGLTQPIAVVGPVVVAVTTDRLLVTLSSETGELFWTERVNAPVLGPPVRDGDRFYISTGRRDERVYAIDTERGRRIWAQRTGVAIATPALGGDTLYVATSAGVRALRTFDGSGVFDRRLPGVPVARPVVHGQRVWVATTTDTLFGLDRATGAIEARITLPATVAAPPLLDGDRLYLPLHSGDIAIADLAAHRILRTLTLGAPVLAQPVRAGGAVYALTRSAEVWRIDGDRAERIASLGGTATGSLAAAGDRLLVGRLDGALLAIDLDGTVRWSRDLGDSIVSPAVVSESAVFVPLLRGTLVKLQ